MRREVALKSDEVEGWPEVGTLETKGKGEGVG